MGDKSAQIWQIKDEAELKDIIESGTMVRCSNDYGVVEFWKGEDKYYGHIWRYHVKVEEVEFAFKRDISAIAWLLNANLETGGCEWPDPWGDE